MSQKRAKAERKVISIQEQKMQGVLEIMSQVVPQVLQKASANEVGWIFIATMKERHGFTTSLDPYDTKKALLALADRAQQAIDELEEQKSGNGETDEDGSAVGEGEQAGSISGDTQDDPPAQEVPSLLVSPSGNPLGGGRIMEDDRATPSTGGDEADSEDASPFDGSGVRRKRGWGGGRT